MLDNPKYAGLLLEALKGQGYGCVQENGEIMVSKNGFPVTDILSNGEYRVYRSTPGSCELRKVRSIHESLTEAFGLYEKGAPVASQPKYRMLCEFGRHLLAAKLMEGRYLEFVTWQRDADKAGVNTGHYFTAYEAAKQDFTARCGLVDRNKLFSETEMKLIRQGLVCLGANFPSLTLEQNTLLGKVVERIEMIVPEIRDHEELEHQGLVPDDELEV